MGQPAEFPSSDAIVTSHTRLCVDCIAETMIAGLLLGIAGYAVTIVDTPTLWLGCVAMMYGGAVALSRVALRLRYLHILDLGYAVTRDGITVESSHDTKFIAWHEMDRAEYLPVIPAYRLTATKLEKPILVFAIRGWNHRSPNERRLASAVDSIKSGLRNRLKTRWLPW